MIIHEFYEGCEIFVTGGSGASVVILLAESVDNGPQWTGLKSVVGKALIEKLLRCCDVKRIHLLLRPKKDLSAEQRLDKIRNAKIFRCLRNSRPDALNKLSAIPGDAVLPNLGISESHAELLRNVSVIFHCAATVRFDEPLSVAMELNVGGTLEAVRFAETLQNLKLFMHVSTFYSNPYVKYVEPKLYQSPMDWKLCMRIMDNGYDEEQLDVLTKKMITGFPNTYTFTKNLAESLVNEYRERLPVAIYRPSIVLFALHDPEPGFPPSLMGAMGLFALVGAGILKTVYIHEETRLDLTPQDVGINAMLFYGTKTVDVYKNGTPDEVPVYMFSSAKMSPFTFKYMSEKVESENLWEESAYEKNFLIPGCTYTSSRLYYMFLVFTKQIFPAMIVDLILIMAGRKPALMSIVRKAFITLQVMEPFMFNNYDSPGITHMEEMVTTFEGTDFDVTDDMEVARTEEGLASQIRKMVYKIREILMNEDPSTLGKARMILKIKKFVYNLIRAVLVFFVLRWTFRKLLNYANDVI